MFQKRMKTFYKDGREIETVATAQHFVEFEEHFEQPLAVMLGGQFTHIYYLSWLTSESGLEFKAWLQTIKDVDWADADDDDVAPFQEEAKEGPSPPSP